MSSLQSVKSETISIIFVNSDGTYTLVDKKVEDCDQWWEDNLVMTENNLNWKPYQSRTLHLINNRPVIGHICNY